MVLRDPPPPQLSHPKDPRDQISLKTLYPISILEVYCAYYHTKASDKSCSEKKSV